MSRTRKKRKVIIHDMVTDIDSFIAATFDPQVTILTIILISNIKVIEPVLDEDNDEIFVLTSAMVKAAFLCWFTRNSIEINDKNHKRKVLLVNKHTEATVNFIGLPISDHITFKIIKDRITSEWEPANLGLEDEESNEFFDENLRITNLILRRCGFIVKDSPRLGNVTDIEVIRSEIKKIIEKGLIEPLF